MNFKDLRIAVAGMGRSGLAVALAAKKRGAYPIIYEQRDIDPHIDVEALGKLEAENIPVVAGWDGRLNESQLDILITSPGFGRTHPAICDALNRGKEVWSEVEFAYQIASAPIIAITGTNGKSTTTVLTMLLLQGGGYRPILCGNISGSGYTELTLTEAADTAKPGDVLVAEISSFQLEWIKNFKPKVATITNITPDHLDRYESFEDYYKTKLKIFQNADIGVINASAAFSLSDDVIEAISDGRRVWVCSDEKGWDFLDASVRCRDNMLFVMEEMFDLSSLPIYGIHNVHNLMQAFTCACAFIEAPTSVQLQGMYYALKEFRGLTHRMEFVGEKDGIKIINNSMCTNPMAVIASSKSLPVKQHLLMGGNNKEVERGPLRDYLNEAGHGIYLFGSEAEALNQQLGNCGRVHSSLEHAFEDATAVAKPGEVVALMPGCASSFPYTNFRERGEAFKCIAKEWLGERCGTKAV